MVKIRMKRVAATIGLHLNSQRNRQAEKPARAVVSCALALGFLLGACAANAASPTLDKIKEAGQVNLGHRGSSIPFSFNATGKVEGYAVDIAMVIIAEIEKSIGKKIAVNYQEITPETRTPLIQTGKVDFECSSTTITKERKAVANFSSPYYYAGLAVMSNKTVYPNPPRYSDLKGKTVVVVNSTTGQKFLDNRNATEGYGTTMIKVKENAEAMLLLEQGRANLFLQDDILEAGLRAMSSKGANFDIHSYDGQVEAYGCMSRLGDEEFSAVVERALRGMAKSGALEASYERWFTKPIAGLNSLVINWPMTQATKEAIDSLKK